MHRLKTPSAVGLQSSRSSPFSRRAAEAAAEELRRHDHDAAQPPRLRRDPRPRPPTARSRRRFLRSSSRRAADRRRGRHLRAERVHRLERQDRRRAWTRTSARPSPPSWESRSKVVNATFDGDHPRPRRQASSTSGCRRSPTRRSGRRSVDFVTYFQAGTSFYVKASGGPTINSLADLCGHSVGVERGTTQADDATAQSGKCKSAGKSGVRSRSIRTRTRRTWRSRAAANRSGMADSPVAAYIVKQSNGQFKLTGKPYNTAPYGIAIPKGSGLTKPFLARAQGRSCRTARTRRF